MNKKDIAEFARIIELCGYEGAAGFTKSTLVPMAKEMGCSVLEAARKYANYDEEQDTSWFQIAMALQKADHKYSKELAKLDLRVKRRKTSTKKH